MAAQTATPTSQRRQEDSQSVLNGPAGTPPAGVISNFDNPPNLDSYIYLTLSLCMVFATFALVTRMYTKIILLRFVGYEDYFFVLSWICHTGKLVAVRMAQRSGLGVHMWDIKLSTFIHLRYLRNINSIIYGITVCFIKTSILLQYQRIFVAHEKWKSPTFIAIQLCLWINVLFYLIDTIYMISQCSAQDNIGNRLLTGGRCNNGNAGSKLVAVFNSISDFALLAIPMPALWKLKMPPRKKVLTMGVFAAGILACVTSNIRAYYTWVVLRAADESYSLTILTLTSAAELTIGIMVGSLPIMPKFFQHASTRISRSLPFTFKSAIKSGQGLESASNQPKTSAIASMKRSFAKYNARSVITKSWNDPCHSCAEHHSEYLTLTESDTTSWQTTESVQPQSVGRGTAPRREDLEYGSDQT